MTPDRPQTTWHDLPTFPLSTPENRRKIGCYGRAPGDYSACWCGYNCVDGYGCCPECVRSGKGHEFE